MRKKITIFLCGLMIFGGILFLINRFSLFEPVALWIRFKPAVTEDQAREILKDYKQGIISLSRDKVEDAIYSPEINAFLIITTFKGFLLKQRLKNKTEIYSILFEWRLPETKASICNY